MGFKGWPGPKGIQGDGGLPGRQGAKGPSGEFGLKGMIFSITEHSHYSVRSGTTANRLSESFCLTENSFYKKNIAV